MLRRPRRRPTRLPGKSPRARAGRPFEAPLKDWLAFVLFTICWALIGRALLFLPIHPVAIAIVWLIGFVWGAGYIASGKADADRLLNVWLGYVGTVALASTVVVYLVS